MQMRFRIGLTLIAALLGSLLALGVQRQSPSSEVAETAMRVQALNQQLVTRSKEDLKSYSPVKLGALSEKIRDLLTEYILLQLNRLPSIPASVLAQRIRVIQGQYVVPQEETNTPYVSQGRLGSNPVYVTGYLLYRGGAGAPDTKAVVQAFVRREAKYFLADQVGNDFDRHGLFFAQLTAQSEGELWYLAQGVRFGASHRNLTAILYSFDGQKLRPIWQIRDIPRGELTITAVGVELKYLDLDRYRNGTPPYFHTERFRFARSGLIQEQQ